MKNKWLGLLLGASLVALAGCNTSGGESRGEPGGMGAAAGSSTTSVTPDPQADTTGEPSGGMGAGTGSSTTTIPVEDNSTSY
ncbi:hypothetical protein FGL86_07655 [Pistricoccus aurantiacus]|uniref:Uncharacterized protein n=1 Tax=Pistricoccus aurantiacus TaxID=1883414 RepID=A0A5B8SPE0_9GAMM|nr:hypothetical protein [Pistricoccus aurantiacus]QEA38959.1 hypothetical protein FGL86_07655 [Pistricoccus aurantiacus]